MRTIEHTSTASSSMVATAIDLRTATTITKGNKSLRVARVRDAHENRAHEIGARPPYAYTSACCDERYKRP
jgi:hypothetical protein